MKKLAIMLVAFMAISGTGCAGNKADNTTAIENNSINDTVVVDSAAVPTGPVIKTLDKNIKGADILPAITKQYEGRVVLIDFWATWCGPCRAAMKTIDAIKPELAAKDCVFVYITGETSPLATWEGMIKNIDGDHYRLTDAQWGDLCTQLGIPGIPAYLLLNKDGSVAYSNLQQGGYPGNDILQNNIEVALTK